MTVGAAVNVHYVGSLGSAWAFLLSLVICTLISAITGALIFALRLNALIVTLAVNAVAAAGLSIWMGKTFSIEGQAPRWLITLAGTARLNVSALFVIAVAISAVAAGVLSRTRAGRKVVAVGANRTAAHVLGTRVNVVGMVTFASAGLLYAIAGAFVAGLVQIPGPTLGNAYQLTTISAVAIAGATFAGGPASISSLLAACLLLQLFQQTLALRNFGGGAVVLIQGVLLVLAVSLSTLTQFGSQGYERLRQAFVLMRKEG
jgi:ribose/xylose/arabinose/galactoside ABC-type transport system permease subunit